MKQFRLKSLNLFLSFIALVTFSIAGVSLGASADGLFSTKAEEITTKIYVSATGSNSSTTPTNYLTPFATVRKALDYIGSTLKQSCYVCLLSDLTYNSSTENSASSINIFATNNKYAVTFTSADPTTGNILTNNEGDFGSSANHNKVFTISRGIAGNASPYTMFWLFSGGVITFQNIILDGGNVEHLVSSHEGSFIFLGGSGCSVVPQLTLSTNCVFENNINYTASNKGTDCGGMFVGSSSNIIMESNATIRNCWAGHAGGAIYLYGSIAANDVFTMRDNSLITGCGAYYTDGNYSDGYVIRSNSSIYLRDNAAIVGNCEKNNTAATAAAVAANSFAIKQYGNVFSVRDNARITDNYFVTPTEGTFCNFQMAGCQIDGVNNGGYVYNQFQIASNLGTNAKVSFYPRAGTVSNALAFAKPASGVTLTESDMEHFYLERTDVYDLKYNGTDAIYNSSPSPVSLALGSTTPSVSAAKGPITFDLSGDLVSLKKQDVMVTVGDKILAQEDLDAVSYDASTKTVSITLNKELANSTKAANTISVFVQKNGYVINKNNPIIITNKIPWLAHFISNGGSQVADVTVSKGSTLAKPTNPVRPGYNFIRWCTDTALTKGYDFTSTILADNLYLYAEWKAIQKLSPLSLGINYETALISGFQVDTSLTESFDNYYSLNSDMSSATLITAATLPIDSTWYGKTIYFQKQPKSGDLNYSSSDVLAFSILEKGTAPTAGTRTDPSQYAGNGSLVVASNQEFSSDGGVNWTKGTGVAVYFPAGSTILVRTAATILAPCSNSTSVLIRSKLQTPALSADYATNTLNGLVLGYGYSVSVGGSVSDSIPSTHTGTYSFPDSWIGKSVAITALPKDSDTEVASDAFILNPTKPAAPIVSAQAPSIAGKQGTIYLTSGQRYKLNGSSTWMDVTSSGDVSFDVGVKVDVVTAATSSDPESEVITLTIPAYSWNTPTAAVDYANEILTGLEFSLPYTVNGVSYTSSSSGTLPINTSWFGNSISLIKKAANATEIDSSAQTIALGARPTRPTASNFVRHVPTVSGGNGTIDIPSGYEYRIGTGAWINSPTGSAMTAEGLAGTSVEIRVQATSSHPCSASVSVIIPSYIQVTPQAQIDYDKEVLTNLDAGFAYTISYVDSNGAAIVNHVNADSNGQISISTYLSYAISLVKDATSSTESASNPQGLVLAGRGSAPASSSIKTSAPSASGLTGTITVDIGYEYSADNGLTWTKADTSVITITSKAGVAFLIRQSAIASAPASLATSVFVPNYKQATPSASVDYATETLTGLIAGASYSIESNGALKTVQADSKGEIAITAYLNSTILLRKLAEQNDGTDTTSDAQTITLANKEDAPAKSLFTISAPQSLNGQGNIIIPADCEYFDTATNSWDSTQKTVYLQAGVSVLVRRSANASTPASQSVELTMLGYTWYKPNPSFDYANGLMTGLVDNGSYSLNGTTITASTSGTYSIAAFYGQNILLTKLPDVSDGTQIQSETATISIGKVPATPDSSIFVAYGPTVKGGNDGYIVVPSGYEYQKADGTWDALSGYAYGVAGASIKIRLAASSSQPCSEACNVSIPSYTWAQPTAVVDYSSLSLTKLLPDGTYTINGNAVKSNVYGVVDISAYLGMSIEVIKLATTTDGTELNSPIQTIQIGAVLAAPTVVMNAPNVVNAQGSIELKKGQQYSLTNGSVWYDVGADATLQFSSGQVVSVRTGYTATNPASEIAYYVIPDFRWATPTGSVDYTTGILSGLIQKGTYTINGQDFTADANGDIDVSSFYGMAIVVVKAKTTTSTHELASYQQTFSLGARPATPLAAQFTTTAPSVAGGEGTIVVPVDFDYFSPYDNTWKSVTGSDYALPVKYGVAVRIRISATSSHPTSLETTVSVPSYQWSQPTGKIDYKNGSISGLEKKGTYTINGSAFTANENGAIVLPDSYYGTTLIIIKSAVYEDGSDVASTEQDLAVLAIPAAPVVYSYAPTSSGAYATVELKAGQRYSIDNGKTWVDVTSDGTVFVDGGAVVYVQTAASDKTPYSKIAKIYVPAYQWTTPTAKIDYANNQLIGLLPNANYSINGATYTSDALGHIALPTSLYGQSIALVKSKTTTDGTEIDSDIQNIALAAIPTAPSTKANTTTSDNMGAVDFKAGQEYSVDGGITWTPVITDESLTFKAGTNLKVRTAANATSPAGMITSITISPYKQATPSTLINYPNGLLTNLVAGATYKINGVAYVASATGEIEIDETWYGLNLSIVKAALTNDGSDADSDIQSLVVLARGTAPSVTSAKSDNGKGTVTITGDEEYSLDNGVTWISGSAFQLVLNEGTNVLVRKKATAFNPASETTSVKVETNFSVASNLPWIITLCVIAWLLIRMLIYIVWHLHGLADGLFILFVPLNRLINMLFFKTPLNNRERGVEKGHHFPPKGGNGGGGEGTTNIYYIYGDKQFGPYPGNGQGGVQGQGWYGQQSNYYSHPNGPYSKPVETVYLNDQNKK